MNNTPFVEEFVSMFVRKDDFERAIFEMYNFQQKIGYEAITTKGDREKAIVDNIEKLKNEKLKTFFVKVIKSKKSEILEPGNFRLFIDELKAVAKRITVIDLTIALELEDKYLSEIADKISGPLKKIMFNVTVDTSIIGGAIIKRDNYIMDFSVKAKLASLSSEWKKSIRAVRGK